MDNGQFNEQSSASCHNTTILRQGSGGIIPYVVDVRHILLRIRFLLPTMTGSKHLFHTFFLFYG